MKVCKTKASDHYHPDSIRKERFSVDRDQKCSGLPERGRLVKWGQVIIRVITEHWELKPLSLCSSAPECQQPGLNVTHHLSKRKTIGTFSGENKLLQRKDFHMSTWGSPQRQSWQITSGPWRDADLSTRPAHTESFQSACSASPLKVNTSE